MTDHDTIKEQAGEIERERRAADEYADALITAQRDRDTALADLATVTAERDGARKNYQFMVNRAMDESLDGYRELGERAANAENEADRLRAQLSASADRCAELEGDIRDGLMEQVDDERERADKAEARIGEMVKIAGEMLERIAALCAEDVTAQPATGGEGEES